MTTINEKVEIYRNYEPITAHNPYSINNEITLIGCNIFLQNNPLNQPLSYSIKNGVRN